MHVDNIFSPDITQFSEAAFTPEHRKFKVRSGNMGKFIYIGLEIKGNNELISMSQNDNVQDLK